MKKYLKMILLMFYPYAYLIPLIVLFSTPAYGDNMSNVYMFIFYYAIIFHILVLFIALYNTIKSGKGKYTVQESTQINLLTKGIQIPAYIFHFCIGLIAFIMGIWGIGIILFVIIVDMFTIILSGLSSIGCSYCMYKEKILSKSASILMGIGSFIFCIDVVIAAVYLVVAKEHNIISKDEDILNIKDIKKSKYPILLVHGMGFRDRKTLKYWGRIPKTLESFGYKVYYGNQDANGTVEHNAQMLKEHIESICINDNIEKFNVIAHSKGGLDMRYAISTLGIGDKIASLTTLATPHNGSITMDKLMKFPKWLIKFFSKITDIWLKIGGDKNPCTYKILESFQTKNALKFNEENPDDERVLYQSYAFVMKKSRSDMLFWFTHKVVKHYEGENDGLLSPESVKWTNFKGIFRGTAKRGVSHSDEVDFRRESFTKKLPQNEYEISDITVFYLNIINELVEKYDF